MRRFKPGELDQRQQKLYKTTVFLAKLILAGMVFRAIIWVYPSTFGLQEALGWLITESLNLFGYHASRMGITVSVNQSAYIISQDCLGWKSAAALIGLSFASGSFENKKRLIALGTAVILAVNLVRIVSTIVLSQTGVVSFDFIHTVLWRWLLTLTVLVAWIAILKSDEIKEQFDALTFLE